LPIIRDVILGCYEKRLRANKTFLRCVSETSAWRLLCGRARLKRTVIQLTGAGTFKRELIARHIPFNTSFSGVYNFARAKNYSKIFPEFLKSITDGGLIMCHPGLSSDDVSDPIYAGRHFEYEYFAGEKFLADCRECQVEIN
jgi:hypothetical protein